MSHTSNNQIFRVLVRFNGDVHVLRTGQNYLVRERREPKLLKSIVCIGDQLSKEDISAFQLFS